MYGVTLLRGVSHCTAEVAGLLYIPSKAWFAPKAELSTAVFVFVAHEAPVHDNDT